ncbi:uncharacterized protein LOC120413817 [Culex pipiens pallens]|uniref:uncharacterized protein LOC120413817 n=1 Tax=Culex pipiens pallens TaxID=42434 RepID=UPI00195423B3|nr:uncharacterized protein LOC120413817 [Culex pipiens pallens]
MQQQHRDDVIYRKITTKPPVVTQPMQSERPKRTPLPQLQNVNQEHIVIVINSEEKQKVINEKRTIYDANIIEITFVCMQLDHVSDHERSNYGQFPVDPRRSTPIGRRYDQRTPVPKQHSQRLGGLNVRTRFKSGHDQ